MFCCMKRRYLLSVLIGFLHIALAQSICAQVSGIVKDASSNEILIGVNVIESNSLTGTSTDFNGEFEIEAVQGDTLLLSYIGYTPTEIVIGSKNVVEILLTENSELLDEVVVVGYGAVDKKDLTGVVSKLSEDDFIQASVSSPETLLNGKVAGLQINASGEPGGGARLRLRGGTSLGASTSPLIVLDGVPLDSRGFSSSRNPLNFINATDIESMTVLKDASASAIYGSRGANGVIIITTKSGQTGRPSITYNGNVNLSLFQGDTDNLSPNNFRNAIQAKAPQELEFLGDVNTNWVDQITQTAQSTEHNLAVSGGTENIKYHVSGGYLNSNGVLNTSNHEKLSASANLSTSVLNDVLKISYKGRIGKTNDVFTPNVMGAALGFDPTRPVMNGNEQFGGWYQWRDPLSTANPAATIALNNNTGETTRLLNNITLTYDLPIDGLSVTSNSSYDQTTGTKLEISDPLDKSNFDRGGRRFDEELKNYSLLQETYANYKYNFSELSSIDFTAGHSWQEFDQENRWIFGNTLELDAANEYQFTTDIERDSFLVTNRLISFFSRANLSIDGKYLFTASLRRDGSSRFGDQNRWGLFPAAAFAWRVLEEDFARGLSNTFSDLKLRLSWGVTGNEDIPDFLFRTFYNLSANDSRYQFGDEFVNTLRGTGVDPGIKWEETTSMNLGLDFGFFNNRLSGSVDVYRKYTDDLIFTIAAPAFTNLSDRILTNVGEMENRGVELSLNAVLFDKKDFDVNLGFNLAFNQNEIKKLDNANVEDVQNFIGYEAGGISGDIGQTIQILRVGESIETFLTYRHKIGEDGRPLPDSEDFNGDGLTNLLDIYEDINQDGLINENDLVAGESAAPDLILGFSPSVRFKQFDLSATLRSHIGNYVYNNVASASGYFERLTERVTNNVHESAFLVNFNKRQLKSDYYIEDASFVKLDNVSFGYTLSELGPLKNARIHVAGNNLLTMTSYSGLDPELPQFSGGIDNNLYPISTNLLIGLSAKF